MSVVPLCSLRHPCQVPLFSKGGHGPRVPSWFLGRTPPCTDTCAALCGQSNRVDPKRPEKRGEADGRGLQLSLCTPTLQLIPLLLPPRYSEGYRQDRGQFHLLREWLDPRGPLDSVGALSFMGHLPATQTKRGTGRGAPSKTGKASAVKESLLLALCTPVCGYAPPPLRGACCLVPFRLLRLR